MKRLAVVLALVLVLFGLRMIPAAPARAGGLCSVPVISTLCSVVSGVTDGISWTVDSSTGLVKDAAGAVIAKLGSKLTAAGCIVGAAAVTDGIGGVALSGICKAASDKLLSLLGKKTTPTTGTAGGTTASPTTTSPASSDPPDTPAHYLSTSALAAGAALFTWIGH